MTTSTERKCCPGSESRSPISFRFEHSWKIRLCPAALLKVPARSRRVRSASRSLVWRREAGSARERTASPLLPRVDHQNARLGHLLDRVADPFPAEARVLDPSIG